MSGQRGTEAGAADASARPVSTRPFVDYSAEMRVTRNPALRTTFRALGVFFVALGTAGYILPGLPGTVFILIAAYFFARSSPRFYNWLMNHEVFGVWVRDFRAGKGLPRRLKLLIPTVIAVASGFSMVVWANKGRWWAVALTGVVAAYGIWYVLHLPTRVEE